MDETKYSELKLINNSKSASVYIDDSSKSLIIKSTGTYIPIEEFQEVFKATVDVCKDHSIIKTVFDKRSLKVFHQPSMEWYFTVWKEELFSLGIKKHIKILPDDFVFKSSVKIGREKIDENYTTAKYHKTSIIYVKNIEEALSS
jgi:hypothetical protein